MPTEAEWEYACRGAGGDMVYAGTSLTDALYGFANYCDKKCEYEWRDASHEDGYKKLAPSGSKQPNQLGLYDMSGNVWEWVLDNYDDSAYTKHEKANPVIKEGDMQIGRGGSWVVNSNMLRCSIRRSGNPDIKANDLGFRLIRVH